MIARGVAMIAGGLVALTTPLWTTGARLARLVTAQPVGRAARRGDPEFAVRVARFALRVLARLPGRLWRNTCLYRSIAECLVLRHYGIGSRLEIGVDRGSDNTRPIAAHAWVSRGRERPAPFSFTRVGPVR